MRRTALALVCVALFLSGCGGTGTSAPTRDQIEGYWWLESFTIHGVETPVEVGVTAREVPWVYLAGFVEGNGGCNQFGGGEYLLEDGILHPGEIGFDAALCAPTGSEGALMAAETAMQDLLWGHAEEGFVVEVSADTMVWRGGDTRLTFIAADGRPPDG